MNAFKRYKWLRKYFIGYSYIDASGGQRLGDCYVEMPRKLTQESIEAAREKIIEHCNSSVFPVAGKLVITMFVPTQDMVRVEVPLG